MTLLSGIACAYKGGKWWYSAADSSHLVNCFKDLVFFLLLFDISLQSFVFCTVNVNVLWNSWQLRSALATLPLSDELQAPLASGRESLEAGNEPKPAEVAAPSAHPHYHGDR